MELLKQLQTEFGDAVVARPAGDTDAVDDVSPQAVAAPRDAAAAHALVAWCGREKIAFIARGGGTKLSIGAPPERCDLIVSTEHLNRVVEHDEGNATVQAEAGISLAKLNEEVNQRGQFVLLEGVAEGQATLGGVVASNYSGMTRLKYGTPRDQVVGLHAALSDGRLVKAGSKVVKNVSGYDLNKIFIGSWSTLGLITEVTLRLRPNDAASATWQNTYASWRQAAQVAQFILDAPFEPTALRLIAEEDNLRLVAHFNGGEAAVQTQIDRLPASEATDGAAEMESLNSSVQPHPHELQLRAALPLQSAAAWAQRAQEFGAACVLWDCGLGVVHAVYRDRIENASSTVAALREAALREDGFAVVERAPAVLKTPDFVWGAPRSDFALMQRLKSTFDPARVCAPGRFVGGL